MMHYGTLQLKTGNLRLGASLRLNTGDMLIAGAWTVLGGIRFWDPDPDLALFEFLGPDLVYIWF